MRRTVMAAVMLACVAGVASEARALSRDRWLNPQPYGMFFNDYQPNFYAGFVPREQDRRRITIHLGRGNQLRLRIVLSDAAIDGYLPSQVARHDLYQELIAKGVITLTTNTTWEAYDQRFKAEGLADLARKKDGASAADWRALNLAALQKLMPERVHHVQKDFPKLLDDFAARLKAGDPPATLDAKLDAVNDLFPHRIFATELAPERDAALTELVQGGGARPDRGGR